MLVVTIFNITYSASLFNYDIIIPSNWITVEEVNSLISLINILYLAAVTRSMSLSGFRWTNRFKPLI